MRIVGGKYKGRIFNPGKKFSARPTTDLAKEALFNILENRYDFSSMKILDLFSGTGSIAYEFVSRGACEVTLVEQNFSHVRFIKEVIEALKIENARVVREDVFRFLKRCPGQFDLIFADPPFSAPFINDIPQTVFSSGVLAPDGLFILEHPKDFDFSHNENFSELRKYGKVNFSFFKA
ncbi:16S rRNA (guanine(966)-N(2))-methyltransferase RsmD [Mariniphaga anaerophila]|uniref:16S rRNA (Guanine(966)-N(2))-methyltransferase RsmD n=1 Tax=Mariniphaga anaerophila TaxID=1484053 RepID=A0A1M4SHU2_9BACT|nr:16S rRNA (guanine(966)-N(2))-methyltransferase RsmD [Mariniphaga anaerophila]SHE31718.1 16S rRNA (guanine(966)-N(2))-methyltransferase RsmD [Mariniphaga anaerophila]